MFLLLFWCFTIAVQSTDAVVHRHYYYDENCTIPIAIESVYTNRCFNNAPVLHTFGTFFVPDPSIIEYFPEDEEAVLHRFRTVADCENFIFSNTIVPATNLTTSCLPLLTVDDTASSVGMLSDQDIAYTSLDPSFVFVRHSFSPNDSSLPYSLPSSAEGEYDWEEIYEYYTFPPNQWVPHHLYYGLHRCTRKEEDTDRTRTFFVRECDSTQTILMFYGSSECDPETLFGWRWLPRSDGDVFLSFTIPLADGPLKFDYRKFCRKEEDIPVHHFEDPPARSDYSHYPSFRSSYRGSDANMCDGWLLNHAVIQSGVCSHVAVDAYSSEVLSRRKHSRQRFWGGRSCRKAVFEYENYDCSGVPIRREFFNGTGGPLCLMLFPEVYLQVIDAENMEDVAREYAVIIHADVTRNFDGGDVYDLLDRGCEVIHSRYDKMTAAEIFEEVISVTAINTDYCLSPSRSSVLVPRSTPGFPVPRGTSLRANCENGQLIILNFTNSEECVGTFQTVNDLPRVCGRYLNQHVVLSCLPVRCFGVAADDVEHVCSGHGTCIRDDVCDCSTVSLDEDGKKTAFTGDRCSEEISWFSENVAWFLPVVVIAPIAAVCLFLVSAVALGLGIRYNSQKDRERKLANELGRDMINVLLKDDPVQKGTVVPKFRINRKLFSISAKEFEIVRVLGAGGSSSTVYLVKWRRSLAAYKQLNLLSFLEESVFREFERELEMMSSIHHPHIAVFYGALMEPPRFGFLMEFCSKGDLKVFLQSRAREDGIDSVPLTERIRFLSEIALAVEYLHSRNVMHRDLKPANVLVTESEMAKIVDFGLSVVAENPELSRTVGIGTVRYMAPEIIRSSRYSNKVDVYSFAILAFEVLAMNFTPYDREELISFKVSANPDFRPSLDKLGDLKNKRPDLVRLIQACWDHAPAKRPTFKEILSTISADPQLLPKPVTVYIRGIEEKDGDAEDFVVSDLSLSSIFELVSLKWPEKPTSLSQDAAGTTTTSSLSSSSSSSSSFGCSLYVRTPKNSELIPIDEQNVRQVLQQDDIVVVDWNEPAGGKEKESEEEDVEYVYVDENGEVVEGYCGGEATSEGEDSVEYVVEYVDEEEGSPELEPGGGSDEKEAEVEYVYVEEVGEAD